MKKKKKKINLDKLFSLDWKKILIVIVGSFLSIMIHNGIYAWLGWEEPVFLIIAVIIIPAYFFFSVFYSLAKWIKRSGWKEK